MIFLILLLLKCDNVFAAINWLVNQIRQWVERICINLLA